MAACRLSRQLCLRDQSCWLCSGGYAPNSDILSANDSINGNWTYTYDDFNRLLTANATGQAYTYDYDRFGNRWHQNGPHSSQLGFDANNHITSVTHVGYDLAGNLTSDGSGPGAHAYFCDAENRIIQVDGTLGNCSTATACYVYNTEGQRVRKTTGSTSVDFLYDLAGNQITELSSSCAWNSRDVIEQKAEDPAPAPVEKPAGESELEIVR